MEELFKDAKDLGITNLGELQMFKEREQRPGETLSQSLKRFKGEVGLW